MTTTYVTRNSDAFHADCAVEFGIEQGVLSPGARGMDLSSLLNQVTESGYDQGIVLVTPVGPVETECARCGNPITRTEPTKDTREVTGVQYMGQTYTVEQALNFAAGRGHRKPSYMSLEDAADYARNQGYNVTLVYGQPEQAEPEGGVIGFAPGEVSLDLESGEFSRNEPDGVLYNGTRYTLQQAVDFAASQGYRKPVSMSWEQAAQYARDRGYNVTLTYSGAETSQAQETWPEPEQEIDAQVAEDLAEDMPEWARVLLSGTESENEEGQTDEESDYGDQEDDFDYTATAETAQAQANIYLRGVLDGVQAAFSYGSNDAAYLAGVENVTGALRSMIQD